jgi:hypothetical protein
MKMDPVQDDVSYVGSDLQYPTLRYQGIGPPGLIHGCLGLPPFLFFFFLRFGAWGIPLIPVGAHIPVGNARALIPHVL